MFAWIGTTTLKQFGLWTETLTMNPVPTTSVLTLRTDGETRSEAYTTTNMPTKNEEPT